MFFQATWYLSTHSAADSARTQLHTGCAGATQRCEPRALAPVRCRECSRKTGRPRDGKRTKRPTPATMAHDTILPCLAFLASCDKNAPAFKGRFLAVAHDFAAAAFGAAGERTTRFRVGGGVSALFKIAAGEALGAGSSSMAKRGGGVLDRLDGEARQKHDIVLTRGVGCARNSRTIFAPIRVDEELADTSVVWQRGALVVHLLVGEPVADADRRGAF